MPGTRKAARRHFGIEVMEARLVPSGAGSHALTASPKPTETNHAHVLYVAHLSPANVVLPVDVDGNQIQGGGGAAMYPLPPSNDPAHGTVTFYLTGEGKEIDVSISLTDVSNLASITINDLVDKAVFPLRGTTTSPATQPPALQPNTKPPSPAPVGLFYTGDTTNTATYYQSTPAEPGQVMSSNIGQIVDVLLKPTAFTGTISHNSVRGVIMASDLTGPLAGQSLAAFIKAFRQTVPQPNGTTVPALYVNVDTSSGIGAATGAEQAGNFPNGELRGEVVALHRHPPKTSQK
jgi:hypothetical protein